MASQKTIQYSTELKAFVVATTAVVTFSIVKNKSMLLDSTTDYNFFLDSLNLYLTA